VPLKRGLRVTLRVRVSIPGPQSFEHLLQGDHIDWIHERLVGVAVGTGVGAGVHFCGLHL
jgi:hypothetical protein